MDKETTKGFLIDISNEKIKAWNELIEEGFNIA